MTGILRRLLSALVLPLSFVSTTTLAQETEEILGQPQYGEIGLQQPATPIMDSITAFHNGLLIWIISAIVLFVLLLLVWVMVRYNRHANPEPRSFSHNTLVEVVWVVIPVVILLVIAAPSFAVLADQMTVPDGERKYLGSNIFSMGDVEVPEAALTVKVTGYQWYWGYEYVDDENEPVGFDSIMIPDDQLQPGQPRLLSVDNPLVVPVDTTVRVQVTAGDVIHSFAMPSFGIKTDAVPGRLNETWFNVRKTGMYYGQCSELCGKDHAYMPIAVRVVEKDVFENWLQTLQDDSLDSANMTLAEL